MRVLEVCATAAAVLILTTTSVSAQNVDCTELNAVVAAAVRVAEPAATDSTLPLAGTDCDGLKYGMPKCIWLTDDSGHAKADALYQSLFSKITSCYPTARISDNNPTDVDVGKRFVLDSGRTIDLFDYLSKGGVMLAVDPSR